MTCTQKNTIDNLPHYDFSDKYDAAHAQQYFRKHQSGLRRRLSNWREHAMARQALKMAGGPASVLDLPCGTGRFWELLTEQSGRVIRVADNSQDMIDVGLAMRSPEVTRKIVEAHCCSAFATGFPENHVECVFCFRLLHHIGRSEDRIRMLREFSRISSETVIISLWVDGNYHAYRHQQRRARKDAGNPDIPHNRYVISRQDIEADIAAAGMEIVGHIDFLKFWEKWRVYVLKK